jgi:hypothetical protein
MIKEELLSYVRQQLQKGVSKEEIAQNLLNNGWQIKDIDEAFNIISNPDYQSQQQPPQAPISSLPGSFAILKEAFSIYRKRFGTLITLSFLPILVTYIATFLWSDIFVFVSKIPIIIIILGIVLIVLMSMIIEALVQVALIYAVKDSQENIGVIESYRRGWHKILPYLWVTFLTALIVMGGFVLFIIPGFLFAFWFGFSVYVLVSENLTGMDALLKSRDYMKGKFGSVAWRLFVVGVIFFAFSLMINFIFGILGIKMVESIGSFLLNLLATPLLVIYSFLLYSKLREIKGDFAFDNSKGRKTKYIIIGVIGLLIGIALFFFLVFSLRSLGGTRSKVQDVMRMSELSQIRAMLEIYNSENDTYPSSLNQLDSSVPVDPKTSLPYQYQLLQGGKDFRLCAKLSDGKEACLISEF